MDLFFLPSLVALVVVDYVTLRRQFQFLTKP